MAFESELRFTTMETGQDLSANLFHFVSLADDGQIDTTTDGASADGVLHTTRDEAGRAVRVAVSGVSKLVAGGQISIGDKVASDGDGKAKTAEAGDRVLGIALEAAAESGIVIAVRLKLLGEPNA